MDLGGKPKVYMVFDVESIGIHGVGFAYGFVVVDADGNELDSGYGAIKPDLSDVPKEDADFLRTNVIPALWGWTHRSAPDGEWRTKLELWAKFRSVFWDKWIEWKEKGASLVTDCGWPVEARFLAQCVDEQIDDRRWNGPYPLLDLSSVLLAAGKDPTGTFERKYGEKPEHNPLCDARQSARILIETLKELNNGK